MLISKIVRLVSGDNLCISSATRIPIAPAPEIVTFSAVVSIWPNAFNVLLIWLVGQAKYTLSPAKIVSSPPLGTINFVPLIIAITVTLKSGNKSTRFLNGVSRIGQSALHDTPNIVTSDLANSATSNAPGVLH